MIDLLLIAMFQAATGEPQFAPADQVERAERVPQSVVKRRERHALLCDERTVLGSRIGQRVCASRADLEEQRRETQAIAHRMHRSTGPH